MRKLTSNTCTILLLLFLSSCGLNSTQTQEITVYVSADEHIARKVFEAFTLSTGIRVLWVGDTEATKTTSLVQRLLREKNDPVADVFWSSEILTTIQLSNADIFKPHHSLVADAWPIEHRDKQFKWFGFSPRARVIAYDPTRVSKSELPTMWWDYGSAAMADPRFGTTGTHLAVMALFQHEFPLFASSIKGSLLGGNAATVQAVIDGTVQFAMTDSDDVHAAVKRGASVAMHFPRHHKGVGGGTLLIPNTVGIIQGTEHQELAALFVDFLLSDEIATLLANSSSRNIPLQPNVISQFPSLVVEDPLIVDFYEASEIRLEVINDVMETLQTHEE